MGNKVVKAAASHIDVETLAQIAPADLTWLEVVFSRFDEYPCLEQVWLLMDEVWVDKAAIRRGCTNGLRLSTLIRSGN